MRFSMVKVVGFRRGKGSYEYESTIMETGGSTPWKNSFENQYEMVSVINAILAKQKRERDVRSVMSTIHDGGHYFFDVDMTEEQARSLGWRRQHETLSTVAAD